jgi:hypothetical protein
MFGLPQIKELGILKAAIGLSEGENMTLEGFRRILMEGEQLGFV